MRGDANFYTVRTGATTLKSTVCVDTPPSIHLHICMGAYQFVGLMGCRTLLSCVCGIRGCIRAQHDTAW